MAQHADLEILGAPRSEPLAHEIEDASGQGLPERGTTLKPPRWRRSGRHDDDGRPLLGSGRCHLPIIAKPLVASLATG
jgi:hypothetical protein